jgi:hypothetical protein
MTCSFASRFATAIAVAIGITTLAHADVTIDTPLYDRYHYPFAPDGGTRATANTFSTNVPNFDNRDAEFLVRWDTAAAGIAPGQAPVSYTVTGVTITLWHVNNVAFQWDTRTPVNNKLQVFGMGVNSPNFTKATWTENTPYEGQAGAPGGPERNPHPLNIDDTAPTQNVSNDLAATEWGLGEPIYGTAAGEYNPGGTPPPAPFPVTYTLNIANARVLAYVQQSLADGYIDFVFSTDITLLGPGGTPPLQYPRFYTKEETDPTGDYAPTITIFGVGGQSSVDDWSLYN